MLIRSTTFHPPPRLPRLFDGPASAWFHKKIYLKPAGKRNLPDTGPGGPVPEEKDPGPVFFRPILEQAAGSPVLAAGLGSFAQNLPTRERMKIARMDGISETDLEDIEASLDGEEEAFARIVRRYQGEIAAYMWRFAHDASGCEELVHDVFVEAYLSLGSYKGKAPFLHWLRKLATRVGYRHWKRLDRERAHPWVPLEEDKLRLVQPHEVDDPAAASEQIHRLLSHLPPRDHLVLTLLYLEDCTVKEAAELTGWSRAMVKVQAHRARKKLLKFMEQENGR